LWHSTGSARTFDHDRRRHVREIQGPVLKLLGRPSNLAGGGACGRGAIDCGGVFRARERATIGEVLLPEPDTIDFLEEIAERVPGMHEIRFLGASGSCTGQGYTALV
jgi:hypothetical protein